jgi:hypothetical protein
VAAKDIDGLAEAVVVDQARVDGEEAHERDDVATAEKDGKYLRALSVFLELFLKDDHGLVGGMKQFFYNPCEITDKNAAEGREFLTPLYHVCPLVRNNRTFG